MLAMAVRNTRKLIRERSAADNVRLGRFFTKRETAAKMASMFTFLETKPLMEILDPGAGTGILSAALLEAVCLGRAAQEIRRPPAQSWGTSFRLYRTRSIPCL